MFRFIWDQDSPLQGLSSPSENFSSLLQELLVKETSYQGPSQPEMQGMGQNVPFRFPKKLPGSVFVLSAIQMVTSNHVQHLHPSGNCCPWLGIFLPALQNILTSSCLLPSATPSCLEMWIGWGKEGWSWGFYHHFSIVSELFPCLALS